MVNSKITIKEIIGGYKSVTLSVEEAMKLLKEIAKDHYYTLDIRETERILENFQEFYNIQTKKGKSYLIPHKDTSELIKGLVVVDKIRLFTLNDKQMVEIVFDKRFSKNNLNKYVKNMID